MWPFELIATPTASAMIMSLGILKKSGTTWNLISGAFWTSCGLGHVLRANRQRGQQQSQQHETFSSWFRLYYLDSNSLGLSRNLSAFT